MIVASWQEGTTDKAELCARAVERFEEPFNPGDTLLVDRSVRRSRLQMQADLTLRLPREDEEEEFLRAHRATSPKVPYFLHYYKEGMPFSRYLEVLAEQERGVNLPPNHVPSTFSSRLSQRG